MPHRDSGNGIVPPGADPCGDVSSHAATSSEPSGAFTPGPWAAVEDPFSPGRWFVQFRGPIGGADICGSDVCAASITNGKANARLIAAAPDLYEALKNLLSDHDRLSFIDAACAALARSEGR